MIHFHVICDAGDSYWPMFVDTYVASFPIDEQRPIANIARLLTEERRFRAMALLDGEGRFMGLLTTWNLDTFLYIEHFAMDASLRSQGYGSLALQAFIQASDRPLVLEVEPPTDALARRRIGFYQRCGLALYDFDYMQPAYTPECSPVPLCLMGTLPQEASLAIVAELLHREVYGVSSSEKMNQ